MSRLIFCLVICCGFLHGEAKVLSLEILQRDTILNGHHWGSAGPYELLRGKIFYGTDPANEFNEIVTDIKYTTIDEYGLVRSSGDIVVLKPIDQTKSNLALVEVSNRGGNFSIDFFLNGHSALTDPNDPSSFGDGRLLKQGVTMVFLFLRFNCATTSS